MNGTRSLGLVTLILGVLILIFPLASIFTLSVLSGVAILFIGLWLFILGARTWSISRGPGILYLILGIFGIILAIAIIGNITLFSVLTAFWIYLVGIILIIAGIASLFAREEKSTRIASLAVCIIGVIYLVVGTFARDPIFLAWLIGLALVIDGIGLLI
ncbi:MAG: DUF308 domain-containing protein [Methanothermobacter sp.]